MEDFKTNAQYLGTRIDEPLLGISIVIAIYNRKNELFELLSSLIRQTDKDFEIIIVDDGSIVDLKPTVNAFEQNLNIHYYKKENTGPGLSRNYGAWRARNPWLIFLDSDVILEKDYIEKVRENIQKTPCDAFGGADKAHKGFNIMQKAISYSMTSIFTTGGVRGNKKSVMKFQPRSFNMGVKKSAFQEVGGFSNLRIGEDPDLSMTLWEHGFRTAFFDGIAVYHKRRIDLGKFSKQVYQFGCARPILNQRHPLFVKYSFAFPTLFLLGFLLGVVDLLLHQRKLILSIYGIYSWVVILHASIVNRNISIGIMATIATYVQMFSYGYGFLKSWVLLNIFRKKPEQAFPNHFYEG